MIGKQIREIGNRAFPRISVNPTIKVSGEVEGVLINISEGGICIATFESMLLKKYSVNINFSGKNFSVPVEIIWCTKCEEGDEFLCGGRIFNVDKDTLTAMRRYMITKQFKYVVQDVKDRNKRRKVLKFAKDFRDYIFDLIDLRESVKRGILSKEEIQKKVTKFSHSIVEEGEKLRVEINDEQLAQKIKESFRELVGAWVFKSKIMKRGLIKPKGYPGDYETLEIIYNNEPLTDENCDLGRYFDVSFLNNPYAKAVRERKNKLKEIVENVLKERKSPIKILNLACGACKEIRDICSNPSMNITNKETFFYCLDWDKEALAFSKEELTNAPKNFHIEFIEDNVLNFIRRTRFYDENGKQDLIYSIGLADYFSDRIIKTMVKNAFHGLKCGGKFIIAHKDKDVSFSHIPPEWFCDWIFYQRNEKDLLNIIEDLKLDGLEIATDRDRTGDIFFYVLTKL